MSGGLWRGDRRGRCRTTCGAGPIRRCRCGSGGSTDPAARRWRTGAICRRSAASVLARTGTGERPPQLPSTGQHRVGDVDRSRAAIDGSHRRAHPWRPATGAGPVGRAVPCRAGLGAACGGWWSGASCRPAARIVGFVAMARTGVGSGRLRRFESGAPCDGWRPGRAVGCHAGRWLRAVGAVAVTGKAAGSVGCAGPGSRRRVHAVGCHANRQQPPRQHPAPSPSWTPSSVAGSALAHRPPDDRVGVAFPVRAPTGAGRLGVGSRPGRLPVLVRAWWGTAGLGRRVAAAEVGFPRCLGCRLQ